MPRATWSLADVLRFRLCCFPIPETARPASPAGRAVMLPQPCMESTKSFSLGFAYKMPSAHKQKYFVREFGGKAGSGYRMANCSREVRLFRRSLQRWRVRVPTIELAERCHQFGRRYVNLPSVAIRVRRMNPERQSALVVNPEVKLANRAIG